VDPFAKVAHWLNVTRQTGRFCQWKAIGSKPMNFKELISRVHELEQSLIDKESQIGTLIVRLKERDALIAAKEVQLAAYLHRLRRIEASPWWRLGARFDHLLISQLQVTNRLRRKVAVPGHLDSVIILPLSYRVPSIWPIPRMAVLLHVYYVEELVEIQNALKNIPFIFSLFVSTDSEQKKAQIERSFVGWTGGTVEVHIFPNRGRDIAPKFVGFRQLHEQFEFVLHLHTKRSPYGDSALLRWRSFLLDCLLGSPDVVASIFDMFRQCPDLGIIAPRNFAPIRHAMIWGVNLENCATLARSMGISIERDSPIDFAAGSMFWARSSALKPLLDLGLTFDSFDEERGQTDGTLGHAIERLTFYSCELAGYKWLHAGPEQFMASFEKAFRVEGHEALGKLLLDVKVDLLATR